jgi:hypothetical protein
MNEKIKKLLENAEQSDAIARNKWRIENREQLRKERKEKLKELMEKDKQQMKTYRKIATVEAKLFEEGDEDGFISRFYDDDDVNEDGSISTSGFMGEHEIKVPYVSTLENQKHLSKGFGREYICVGIDGERWLVDKDIFELTYKEVTNE